MNTIENKQKSLLDLSFHANLFHFSPFFFFSFTSVQVACTLFLGEENTVVTCFTQVLPVTNSRWLPAGEAWRRDSPKDECTVKLEAPEKFTWMVSSLKRCGSERIGSDEEGTSSGRAELGGYTAGQGGKASLANTSDADILEFIVGKLRSRIAANAKTFLVKIKAHRGEPLNERVDDLADEGKTLVKAGDSYP